MDTPKYSEIREIIKSPQYIRCQFLPFSGKDRGLAYDFYPKLFSRCLENVHVKMFWILDIVYIIITPLTFTRLKPVFRPFNLYFLQPKFLRQLFQKFCGRQISFFRQKMSETPLNYLIRVPYEHLWVKLPEICFHNLLFVAIGVKLLG